MAGRFAFHDVCAKHLDKCTDDSPPYKPLCEVKSNPFILIPNFPS